MEEIVNDAKARDPKQQRVWIVLLDGALHLWSMIFALLKGFKFIGILDIIHVAEYLWKAANALYGEGTCEGKRWVYEHLLCKVELVELSED